MNEERQTKIDIEHDSDETVDALVSRAQHGESDAWELIVRRFSGLVRGIASGFRMSPADAEDVAQTVWLKLFEHLAELREPKALPGWIRTTATRECVKSATGRRRTVSMDTLEVAALEHATYAWQSGRPTFSDPDEDLLREESRQAVSSGLALLPRRQRVLLALLVQEPPLAYHEIGERLGIPVGSIGPTRARGLKRLRDTPTVREVIIGEPSDPAA